MTLAHSDFEKLREKIQLAYEKDDPFLNRFRQYAKRLKHDVKPLRNFSANAISFISTDGGDNRVVFNPAVLDLVRVVDSHGKEYVLDALPGTTDLSKLNDRIDKNHPNVIIPLQRMCEDLNIGDDLDKLSFQLRGIGQPGKNPNAIRIYRDIVEWAVLYDMITNHSIQWGGNTILIRDGLLRTKSFRLNIFHTIKQNIQAGIKRHAEMNVSLSIVGVAKQSAVLSRLAVALELESALHKPYPCYVQVADDIEKDCYNIDSHWFSNYDSPETDENRGLFHAMGKMFLVKFGDRPFDPVWPVDIAEWQLDDTEKILGQLMVDAQQGFPIPDYPMCIQQAHNYAKLNGLEIEIIQDLLLKELCKRLSEDETEKLIRFKHLGRSFASLRYKEM